MNNETDCPLARHDCGRRKAAESTVPGSRDQYGGIRAHTVNITLPLRPAVEAPLVRSGLQRWKQTWVVVSAAVGFVAAMLKILDYFGVKL